MSTIKNNTLYNGIISIIVLILTWSFLGGWFTIFARQWLWVLIGCALVASMVPLFLRTSQFAFLMLYGIIVFINLIAGDPYFHSIIDVLYEIIQLFFCAGLCFYLIKYNVEYSLIKQLLLIGAFVIIFTTIGTYIANLYDPDVVRKVVVLTQNGVACEPFYRMGVCEYAMPHAIPILIAPLIMWITNKDLKNGIKFLCLIVLICTIVLVFISGTTTPLIISIGALVCSLLVNRKKRLFRNVMKIVIVMMIMIPILNKDVQLSILQGLREVVPEENSNYKKIQDFEMLILYEESTGDVEEREGLYNASLSTFFENILMGGSETASLGGHSILLDRLGSLGLIGTIPYLLFIWFMAKGVYLRLSDESKIYYIIGVICFILMLTLKNMSGTWLWITMGVFLPLMAMYPNAKKTKIS